jgi:hypothetical protein
LFKARGKTDDAEGKQLIDVCFEADVKLSTHTNGYSDGAQSPQTRTE